MDCKRVVVSAEQAPPRPFQGQVAAAVVGGPKSAWAEDALVVVVAVTSERRGLAAEAKNARDDRDVQRTYERTAWGIFMLFKKENDEQMVERMRRGTAMVDQEKIFSVLVAPVCVS